MHASAVRVFNEAVAGLRVGAVAGADRPASGGVRPAAAAQKGVCPIEFADLTGGSPVSVALAGVCEQPPAGHLHAVADVEVGRPLGDERPIPGTLPRLHVGQARVEGERRRAEVVDGPSALRVDQSDEVPEVLRSVLRPPGQPVAAPVQLGQECGQFPRVPARARGTRLTAISSARVALAARACEVAKRRWPVMLSQTWPYTSLWNLPPTGPRFSSAAAAAGLAPTLRMLAWDSAWANSRGWSAEARSASASGTGRRPPMRW